VNARYLRFTLLADAKSPWTAGEIFLYEPAAPQGK
jgi:hypothetical protein